MWKLLAAARYVVWFGESIKQEVWKEAVKQSMTCDVMIIVGTSLVVSPANTLYFYAALCSIISYSW
jgi:NAD-dependent SIR2 family protein deacetylase